MDSELKRLYSIMLDDIWIIGNVESNNHNKTIWVNFLNSDEKNDKSILYYKVYRDYPEPVQLNV